MSVAKRRIIDTLRDDACLMVAKHVVAREGGHGGWQIIFILGMVLHFCMYVCLPLIVRRVDVIKYFVHASATFCLF